jgi:hypothetical protein
MERGFAKKKDGAWSSRRTVPTTKPASTLPALGAALPRLASGVIAANKRGNGKRMVAANGAAVEFMNSSSIKITVIITVDHFHQRH